jgi:hypothetical protein
MPSFAAIKKVWVMLTILVLAGIGVLILKVEPSTAKSKKPNWCCLSSSIAYNNNK